jgi:alkylation response protein AidB-like acyl-CoA dehydrogenase
MFFRILASGSIARTSNVIATVLFSAEGVCAVDFQTVEANLDALIARWAPDRLSRMARLTLEQADFDDLAAAGFTLTGVPVSHGGLWLGAAQSAAKAALMLRRLAAVDPSLALVASMHPTILVLWSVNPVDAAPPGWTEQRDRVFDAAASGHWFGTIASEPGIGGDIFATRSTAAVQPDGSWRMSGDKFMGSGSGVTSYMMTIACPEGEERPDVFLLDTRGLAWDGSQGLKMVRAWDGIGMAATQSHAFRFDSVQVERHGLQGKVLDLFPTIAPVIGYMFSAVIMGILDAAAAEAKRSLGKRADRLSAFEQSAWIEADTQIWLAQQAFDGMSRSLGSETAGLDVLHGKLAIADLSEKALANLCHALGGSSLSKSSPFGQWMQDVRALGYLRPPRALSHARIFQSLVPKGKQ